MILKKRGGGELTSGELNRLVAGVVDGSIPDYQLSAFLMAVYFQGMSVEETREFTRAMSESGSRHEWGHLARTTADKHSTGGVGDKVSLVLAPLAAACGLAVPMLSGRGLGFTGGTLDKLESIPGFRTSLPESEFREIMEQHHFCLIGQSEEIAPADKRLYSLRDVTGTVESLPLVVASILSKKLAAGPSSLVIDLKVGRGAFMQDMKSARELGLALRDTAASLGLPTRVLFTNMDSPLGQCVGNGPEMEESLDILAGRISNEVRELSLRLCAEMLLGSGLEEEESVALAMAEEALDSGRALECFLGLCEAQGGRLDPHDERWGLPEADYSREVLSDEEGFLLPFDARKVGELSVQLGAGRERAEDGVDPRAGIRFLRKPGDKVLPGDVLLRVEGSEKEKVDVCADSLSKCLSLGEDAPVSAPLVLSSL
ncbi:MAG: thymidine phosphorylase [Candidatus Krumholzibacteria bacterium]|jgi:pyrimidine-nucleoside phosphorylase|nr:thymidine phosphorylase [Candidatus Krumholzibacteria bacterium]